MGARRTKFSANARGYRGTGHARPGGQKPHGGGANFFEILVKPEKTSGRGVIRAQSMSSKVSAPEP